MRKRASDLELARAIVGSFQAGEIETPYTIRQAVCRANGGRGGSPERLDGVMLALAGQGCLERVGDTYARNGNEPLGKYRLARRDFDEAPFNPTPPPSPPPPKQTKTPDPTIEVVALLCKVIVELKAIRAELERANA